MTDEQLYLCRRAEAELEKARQAADPRVIRAHSQFAEAYLVRVHALTEGTASESRRA